MKETGLIETIVLSFAAILAFLILGNVFVHVIEEIPGMRVYYYIPEAGLFLKRDGNNLCFSEDREQLAAKGRDYYDTEFLIKRDRFASTIYYPIGEHQYGRMYLRDSNNCLQCLRSLRTIVWLADNTSDSEIPPCIEIELPFQKGILHYRTIDGSEHQALKLSERKLDSANVSKTYSIRNKSPFDILPSSSLQGNIEDSHIHIERTRTNNIKLYIRDNYIECDAVYRDTPDPDYFNFPTFYYNPSYPDYIFCEREHTIISRKCKNIQLITSSLIKYHITYSDMEYSDMDNWYIIGLNPFYIKEMSRSSR